jgi:hypothetical protein
MLCPSHPLWLDHSDYTWQRIRVMKLLVMQFSSTAYHFIPLRWNIRLSALFSNTFQSLSIYLSVCLCLSFSLSIYLWLYSPCGPWPLFQFFNLYTVGRTPWTGDQPVARPLRTHRINAHRQPCLERDFCRRSQCSGGRGLMPWTARPLWSALSVYMLSLMSKTKFYINAKLSDKQKL